MAALLRRPTPAGRPPGKRPISRRPVATIQKAGINCWADPSASPKGVKASSAAKIPRYIIQRAVSPVRGGAQHHDTIPTASASPPASPRYWVASSTTPGSVPG